jgi:hypothetical protein
VRRIGIARAIDDLLQPLGFARREGAWNRNHDGLIDVVSLQIDKAGRRLTIEAGVLHPVAYSTCWDKPVPDFVDVPECTIRTRVGQLIDNHDHWWLLDEPSVASEIVESVSTLLLPFLERNNSAEDLVQWLIASAPVRHLRPPETAYLAILQREQGRTAEACALLQRFRQKVLGDWKPKADTLMAKLDCPSSP